MKSRTLSHFPKHESTAKDEHLPLDYSFACGGWLKLYLFGVAKYLQENKLTQGSRFIGCSAGALTATGLALDCNFDSIKSYVLQDIVPLAHGNALGAFHVRSYLRKTLKEHGNLHLFDSINSSQSLVISYSSLSKGCARRATSFKNEKHLEEALLASCCASPIAGLPFQLEGEWVFDGGLTDFQPVFDESTVTVSPMYYTKADIKPSRYVPVWWALYPPSVESVEWLFSLGYHDAHQWAIKNNYVENDNDETKLTEMPHQIKFNTRLGRFLGYRILESKVLDFIFMAGVITLWKPLAFFLMYIELLTRAIICGGKAAVFGAACKIMITLVTNGLLASVTPVIFQTSVISVALCTISVILIIVMLAVGGIKPASVRATRDWKNCVACLRNIVSLSLLLRTLPYLGATVPLKRHTFLLEHSFVYRLVNHFV